LFADKNKIYRSTDNLTNVTEITPLDIAGDPFVATIDSYAMFTNPTEFTIGSTNILMWGTYSVNALTEYININAWCTINEGANIKSVYKAGVTNPPNLAARHIHGIEYNPNNSKVWMWTGDGTDECNIIEGTYTEIGDSWAWAKLLGDNDGGSAATTNSTFYKIGTIRFSGTDVYWVSDSNNGARRGIYKCPYADIADTTKYINIFRGYSQFLNLSEDLNIVTIDNTATIIISNDSGLSYKYLRLYGIPLTTLFYIISKKDTNGYYYIIIKESTEVYGDEYKSKVLKVKLKE